MRRALALAVVACLLAGSSPRAQRPGQTSWVNIHTVAVPADFTLIGTLQTNVTPIVMRVAAGRPQVYAIDCELFTKQNIGGACRSSYGFILTHDGNPTGKTASADTRGDVPDTFFELHCGDLAMTDAAAVTTNGPSDTGFFGTTHRYYCDNLNTIGVTTALYNHVAGSLMTAALPDDLFLALIIDNGNGCANATLQRGSYCRLTGVQ